MRARGVRLWLSLVLSSALLFGGCFREQKGERFYGNAVVPAAQEFRWSDGGLPKVFDPARAAAPPDTDAVRALFEGLTDYEPGTLRPAPAVASRWEPADGGRRWTFHLREGARWTNGDPVTAQDFVRSWRRTLHLGERAPHAALLSNIEGAESLTTQTDRDEQAGPPVEDEAAAVKRSREGEAAKGAGVKQTPRPQSFGVVALDTRTLRVTLRRPDMNFPALVAHPVFRPVHELSPEAVLPEPLDEQRQGGAVSEPGIVTNGAFSLSRLAGDSVELSRAESYWDAASVQLERVRFVASGDTESALAAYRAGEVDVVSNAAVEPLAVKLLTPYEDFRRETFAALNYYRFNTARPPFDDVRVRQALAFALDVERLSKDTLGGATEPTRTFIPPQRSGRAAEARRRVEARTQRRARADAARTGRLPGRRELPARCACSSIATSSSGSSRRPSRACGARRSASRPRSSSACGKSTRRCSAPATTTWRGAASSCRRPTRRRTCASSSARSATAKQSRPRPRRRPRRRPPTRRPASRGRAKPQRARRRARRPRP